MNEERLSGTLSVSFENINGLDRVLDVASKVYRFHGLHSIDGHRCKEVIITNDRLEDEDRWQLLRTFQ